MIGEQTLEKKASRPARHLKPDYLAYVLLTGARGTKRAEGEENTNRLIESDYLCHNQNFRLCAQAPFSSPTK